MVGRKSPHPNPLPAKPGRGNKAKYYFDIVVQLATRKARRREIWNSDLINISSHFAVFGRVFRVQKAFEFAGIDCRR
jgi:hypothetical protein